MARSKESPCHALERLSLDQKSLTVEERRFLQGVQDQDVERVRNMLETDPNLSINCCNFRGERALEIAVGVHDEELVVELLNLSKYRSKPIDYDHYYASILRAVLEQEEPILKILLASYAEFKSQGTDDSPPDVASSNLTPLMAAAINGNIRITRLLMENGHKINDPNHASYVNYKYGESLKESISRINAYRALASPTYIIAKNNDPILEAFQLSDELHKLGSNFLEYKDEYEKLSVECSQFAAALLDQCRDTKEVKTILRQKEGCIDSRPHPFPRLNHAIYLKQKQFVTHPNCQQVIRSVWVGELSDWWSWSTTRRTRHILTHALIAPFLVLFYVLFKTETLKKPLRVPLNRFIYSVVFYVYFLMFLIASLYNEIHDLLHPVRWSEVAVGFWVVGYALELVCSVYYQKPKVFFRSFWTVYDVITFSFFLIAEALWFGLYIMSKVDKTAVYLTREQWSPFHCFLIAEGLYALGTLFAFCRLLFWYEAHTKLGPLSVSLRYMIYDVLKFLLIILVILFSFVIAINSIYRNYKENILYLENGRKKHQPESFSTIQKTFKTLFWAIFGTEQSVAADIVLSGNQTNMEADHVFTEAVGYFLWGFYHITIVIILLNMLIAMMTGSYKRVQENSDTEWKFARSALWLAYFACRSAVPSPLNLIPRIQKLVNLGKKLRDCFWKKNFSSQNTKGGVYKRNCCFFENCGEEEGECQTQKDYKDLIIQLKHRYLQAQEHRTLNTVISNQNMISGEMLEKLRTEVIQEVRKSLRSSITLAQLRFFKPSLKQSNEVDGSIDNETRCTSI
ncbi:short transient receptor potential channel 3-like [Limulus polyphemus]|uniref:Short transient receptor potential channel 3-like n=1 Tax=Limulus polyphemus TaxID=6850 RepID=A0ABM1BBW5_LIMPO|nr:short transient receptor potential channel 3-like [Limulus polyphemus]